MMIDAKKFEELTCRMTEIKAEANVCMTIGDFISANMERCRADRNLYELQAWIDALREITDKLNALDNELVFVTDQLKKMG